MLITLTFSSAENFPMNEKSIRDIITTSRTNNVRKEITGMMLYKDGFFLQSIEGLEEKVIQLFEVISKDERHTVSEILWSEYIPNREFENLPMGFNNLNHADCSNLNGVARILAHNFNPSYFSQHPAQTRSLLLAFNIT